MRFISKYQNYGHRVRNHSEMVLANGQKQIIEEGYVAEFVHGDITEWEREEALRTFKFNGMPTEMDEVTPIDPTYRLSSFDTASINDPELRQMAEERLGESPGLGSDYIHVAKPELAPPWPRYDAYTGPVDLLVKKLVEDGHSLEHAVAYEREHLNRDKVLEALDKAISLQEPSDTLVVS